MIRSILFSTFLMLICFGCNPSSNKKQSTAPAGEKVYDAMVLKAENKPVETLLPAEIRPLESAKIFSKVNGFIKSMHADIGSIVKKGGLLAVIEAPELNAQLAEAVNKKEAAKAKFLSSKDTYDRTRESAETPGVISSSDLEKAKNQLAADSAGLSGAQFVVNSLQDMNNYLRLTMPFNGIVTVRNLNIGDIVGPNSPKPVFEVENNSILRLRAAVPEAMVGNELVNKEVNFTVSAYPEQTFTARFARKAGSLDVSTRSEIWEFETDNSQRKLSGGMYAEIKLRTQRSEPTFYVPKTAVVTTLERSFVICVKNDMAIWVDVSKGNELPDKLEIFGKLNNNDVILVNSNEEIKPGTRIKYKIKQ